MVASLVALASTFGHCQSRTNECETVLVFGTGLSAAGTPLPVGAADPNFKGVSTNFPAAANLLFTPSAPSSATGPIPLR